MPVPQLPIELIQLIGADPALRKVDLQSLSLTARVFPPLVRPHLFKRLKITIGSTADDSVFANKTDYGPAITLDEMDRLMSLRRRPDLAGLVKEVRTDQQWGLKPPPGCIRMTAHDLMQLVYATFPRLEKAAASTEWLPRLAMIPPCVPLPCCEVLHTLHYLGLDAHTWKGLQMCPALRHLSIAVMSLDKGVPAASPSLSLRLETLDFNWLWVNKMEVAAALPATLKRIDFDMALEEGELEAVLSNNSSVNVIGMDGMPDSAWDFCRKRGITIRAFLRLVVPW
ncbi:hypothetical protein B0A53_03619 [Rhodotorula sp. CCFEE 5036]|nr:hypothetical protein B0A53_03619 [Rhodotorula sp. CCFEE 5036]